MPRTVAPEKPPIASKPQPIRQESAAVKPIEPGPGATPRQRAIATLLNALLLVEWRRRELEAAVDAHHAAHLFFRLAEERFKAQARERDDKREPWRAGLTPGQLAWIDGGLAEE